MEKSKIDSQPSLVIIGGSSGSLDAMLKIFSALGNDCHLPFLIVVHRNPTGGDMLSEVLNVKTNLYVKEADEKEPIVGGNVYVAPANYHLLVEQDQTLSLDASEKVNFSRPSIDVTFQSAADVYKQRLVCILLSGANADGADGLAYAQKLGATIIIQDPREAIVPYMPQHAIMQVTGHVVLNSKEIARYLVNRFCEEVEPGK